MVSADFVDCMDLPPGSRVEVETRNRCYRIECLGGNAIRISGHPDYCPTPVAGQLESADSEDSAGAAIIGRGKRLQFRLENGGPVSTSKIMSVRVETPARQGKSFRAA